MQASRHIFLLGALDSVFSYSRLSGLFAFSWAEVKVGSCAVFLCKSFLKQLKTYPFFQACFKINSMNNNCRFKVVVVVVLFLNKIPLYFDMFPLHIRSVLASKLPHLKGPILRSSFWWDSCTVFFKIKKKKNTCTPTKDENF